MKKKYVIFGCYSANMKIELFRPDGSYNTCAIPEPQKVFMEIDEFDISKIDVPSTAVSFMFFEDEDEDMKYISGGYIGKIYDIPRLKEIAKCDANANNLLKFINDRGGDGAIKFRLNLADGKAWWSVYKKGMTVVEI